MLRAVIAEGFATIKISLNLHIAPQHHHRLIFLFSPSPTISLGPQKYRKSLFYSRNRFSIASHKLAKLRKVTTFSKFLIIEQVEFLWRRILAKIYTRELIGDKTVN